LVVEFVFVFGVVTVGFFTTDVIGVFVVGVVGVFVVMEGLVVVVGFVVIEGLVVVVGFVVTAGLVVTDGFVVIGFVVTDGFEVMAGFVVTGLVVDVSVGFVVSPVDKVGLLVGAKEPSVEVSESEVRPVNEGRSLRSRITLSNGARSRPLASGSCLLDVRFFRIAMSYPVFLTNEVKPAILLTGVKFALPAKVFGGLAFNGFPTNGAF
jgi:hypothetical protein